MARILSEDGVIIMNVPFFYYLHEKPYDYYRFTEYALRRFVESAGLEVIILDAIGGAPEVLTDILAKIMMPIPIVGPPLSNLPQWITSVFIKTSIGKKVSSTTARRFPLA
jgi:hypothetical protein